MSEGGAIVPTIVKPIASIDDIVENWKQFEKLKKQLLKPDDYQAIVRRGISKKYIKRSGFRKIAVAFGLSDEIISQTRTDRHDKEDSFTWQIVVKVTHPNGRTCTGVGACDSLERGFAHKEHDIYATAHTRAKSRAISDMVAGGEASAEEMNGHGSTSTPLTEERKEEDVVDSIYTHEIVWSIAGEKVPIPMDDDAYRGFQVRFLKGLREQYGIRFEERTSEDDCVVSLFCSEMKDDEWTGLQNFLTWVIQKIFMARTDEVRVELIERDVS